MAGHLHKHIFVNRTWDHHALWRELFPLGVQLVRDAVRLLEKQGYIEDEPQAP